ncbi:Do family serine endopeptidase [Polyangium sp. y55x31]|uniref:Do family serine endopeptidase n=1 Tax=Polyangium sp. y55x31 TaxID=3042688 RepID=UPI0024821965|nr:Do family serine endopeptidase [Polyangium sp. y55x31]MDI1480423.1 Do family serine endopeptidase [Polyangium sp. y55x31]
MMSVRSSQRASSFVSRSALALLLATGMLGSAGCGHEAHATPPPPSTQEVAQQVSAEAAAAVTAAPAAPAPVPATFDVADLAQRVTPMVVNITTTQKVAGGPGYGGIDPFEFFFGPRGGGGGERAPRAPERQMARTALGTGFIIDPEGFIVTNAHVIEGADDVKVRLADEREFGADVVGRDTKLDLALLKLRGASGLPVAALGSSEALRVGEHVLAVGNPFGLGHTVTLGIVSAKARSIGAGPYDDFIQTDASINPGNSGGPLFNWKGEVIGINTAIRAGANGIGFATPVDALRDILPQLREKGHVERGKLGLLFQPLTADLGKAFGMDTPKGALVSDLEPGGAAARAGIKPGDIVVAVNGTPIHHAEDLPRKVARHAPGTTIKVSLLRSGKPLEVTAKLDQLGDSDGEDLDAKPTRGQKSPAATNKYGFQFSDLAGGGVRVDRVTDSESELSPGDVLLEVNGAPVRDAKALDAALAKMKPGTVAAFKVRRGKITRFAALPIK